MNTLVAVKDYIVGIFSPLAKLVVLQDVLVTCKQKLTTAALWIRNLALTLKSKNIGDCIACIIPCKNKKKENPIATTIAAISAVVIVFTALVVIFYGIFSLLGGGKKKGYHTIKF